MKYFCSHPWEGLDIDPQGKFRPCCKYQKGIASSLDEYLNSRELKKLKQEFIDGKQPVGCSGCWTEESGGIESKRQIDWKYLFDETLPNFIQPEYKILTLAIGNTCNLTCRICDSYASSAWIKPQQTFKKINKNITIHGHKKFYKEEEFLKVIKKVSNTISRVDITGGEPFLTGKQEHYNFLSYLVETNQAKKIELNYTTNGTIFPDKNIIDCWRSFKQVTIRLSIDGLEKHFEYNRWPAEWLVLLKNIDNYKKLEFLKFKIIYVISIFTVYYVPEVTKWCLKHKLGIPHYQILSEPKIYDIRNLPTNVKDGVMDKIKNFPSLISYMNQNNNEKFEKTIEYINFLDAERNQSFKDTFPEFYSILKEAKCQI